MDMLEKIGNNPLLVSVITLILTTIIGGISFLIKKIVSEKQENKVIKYSNQQSNIVQNFSTGISYNDVKQIAEEVAEVVIEDKLNKLQKERKRDITF